ncbi:phytanoyl-CoA dioxygenase family protein [Marinagarivorans cellulosilyticus]|uniref:Phytanoyl-CoA dioxygenase n=1 Tax=Marinagarivorans cellulosilyticus TaxID=2721545 RepID=A0AAN1WI22_9GAMM|nr:phytanoyl-CoA dioxygenase family protein [Marinagarivorans cellulosilyticus]BCD97962.1 hypothetical protein MARGE09_P2163 [Marinagarivorans cellulosilyticus]
MSSKKLKALEQQGFAMLRSAVAPAMIQALKNDCESLDAPITGGGLRRAEMALASVKVVLNSMSVRRLLKLYMGATDNQWYKTEPALVRAILFDKTPKQNWLVAWHQDKTVCVTQRFEHPGWGPWSVKNSVIHVQPPLAVLQHQLALRIHIDDANANNGCLKILPSSHIAGVMKEADIQTIDKSSAVICEAKAGDVLLMKPHVLHASSKAKTPSARRVLHLEFSTYRLPEGIAWAASY